MLVSTKIKATMLFCVQVLFVPLFTVRTHLPAPLIMNVETPRLKKNHREELKGQGHAEQLVMVGGDMTHNITFQLRSVSL